MTGISIIVPTCGRPTLRRALESVLPQLHAIDEVLVVGDGGQPWARKAVSAFNCHQLRYSEYGPTGFLGNAQRNFAQRQAQGELLVFLDDDDYLAADALETIRRVAAEFPDRPCMYRIQFHDPSFFKWVEPHFANENISGGAFVVPRRLEYLAEWPERSHPLSHWSDRVFIEQTLANWPGGLESLVWRPETIYHVPEASNNAP